MRRFILPILPPLALAACGSLPGPAKTPILRETVVTTVLPLQGAGQEPIEELVVWDPNRPGEAKTIRGTAAELQRMLDGGEVQPANQPAGTQAPAASSPTRQATHENELSIWNESSFQRAFAESYQAESDVEPRLTALEVERMLEIRDLIADDKMDKAARLLEEERGGAASAVFDFTLANIYFQREELQHATGVYRTALQKFPKFRRAWRNLGLIHVRLEQFDQAVPALSRVIELGGGDAITYGLLGFSYSNIGDDLSAESAYRLAMLLDSETKDWKMGLARSFFKQKRYADAVALCGQMIAAEPNRTDLWLLQANAFIGLEDANSAAENFELVDRLGGSTADSLNMLGDIYVNDGLFDLAVRSYQRAIEMKPDGSLDRPLRAAKVLIANDAQEETLALLGRIEELRGETIEDEDKKDLLKLRARVAVARGAGEEEARILEEIVALDPLDGEALILLGRHSARQGAVEQAVFWFERAAGLEDYEADAKIRHAQLLVREGRYAEALPLLRRAQTLDPRDHVQDYLEQVERIQGR